MYSSLYSSYCQKEQKNVKFGAPTQDLLLAGWALYGLSKPRTNNHFSVPTVLWLYRNVIRYHSDVLSLLCVQVCTFIGYHGGELLVLCVLHVISSVERAEGLQAGGRGFMPLHQALTISPLVTSNLQLCYSTEHLQSQDQLFKTLKWWFNHRTMFSRGLNNI